LFLKAGRKKARLAQAGRDIHGPPVRAASIKACYHGPETGRKNLDHNGAHAARPHPHVAACPSGAEGPSRPPDLAALAGSRRRAMRQRARRVPAGLLAALAIGLLARAPGIAWGVNWPDGFGMHHPDESTHVINANAIISPLVPMTSPPYPKAMAAHASAPFLAWYAAHGSFGGPRVHVPLIVGAGRAVALAFGLAAIVLVFLVGRDVLGDPRAGVLGAWLLALGGLHVTQSHFFLADVPAATWTLAAVWLLWRDLRRSPPGDHAALGWAAFAAGAAFAFKLFVFVFPALAYAVWSRRPRLARTVYASVFGVAGITISSLGLDTPVSFYRAATVGVNYPFEFDRLKGAMLYAVELPGILSLPLLAAALAGTWSLLGRLRHAAPLSRRHALAVFGSVPLIGLAFILFKLDHFPRHWVFLIPWAAVAGGWALSRLSARLERGGRSPALFLAPVFLWMAALVVDGERYFLLEPRNDALRWLRANVPEGRSVNWVGRNTPAGYRPVRWLLDGEPDVLVVEMHEMNNSLSGVDWRNSFPEDPRRVFDGRSAKRVAAIQALFRGPSPYQAVAHFPDSYVMPEYRLASTLLGDRSRSYISEIVIFERRAGGAAPGGGR
jgi:hypothetical protein